MRAKQKSRVKSNPQKKFQEAIREERMLINKFLNEKGNYKVGTNKMYLSNIEKYDISYTDYVRKKTNASIEKEVQARKIDKDGNKISRFQDFILNEIKFSNENKDKLSNFFKNVRG